MTNEIEQTKEKVITVTVNNKAVSITRGDHVGADIKKAAIAAGLSVTMDFVLTEIHGKNRDVLGDADSVKVNEGSKFALVADDDDS